MVSPTTNNIPHTHTHVHVKVHHVYIYQTGQTGYEASI